MDKGWVGQGSLWACGLGGEGSGVPGRARAPSHSNHTGWASGAGVGSGAGGRQGARAWAMRAEQTEWVCGEKQTLLF